MSDLLLNETGEPSVPAAGKGKIYMDSSDRLPKLKDSKGVINSFGDSELPNYLRNSGFWFCQRQGSAATNCGSTTLRAGGGLTGLDAWGVWNENANTTAARTDTASSPETGLQSQNYGAFLKITSTGKYFVSQMVESKDILSLRGRTSRFQVWMKGTASQTVRLGIVQLTSAGTIDTLPATFISAAGANGTDPTLGTNLSYIAPKSVAGLVGDNCTINGNAFDCSVTTAWQRFGGVFDIPSNCKNILVCVWTNAQLTATNGFSLAQTSLTDGYEIQSWAPLAYQQELERCVRIYTKTFEIDTLPVAAVLLGSLRAVVTKAATALGVQFSWRYLTPMRAVPTISTFNPVTAANTNPRRTGGTAADETTVATANISSMAADITATDAAAGAVGDAVQVQATADAAGSNNEFA